jgi:hypothetical protein
MRQVRRAGPELEVVEWVADHLEARGHLLVRGTTLSQIIGRAQTALGHQIPIGNNRVRSRIHPGWWCADRCRCRRSLACSNHPAWHYHPALAADSGAWWGAEIRLVLRPSAGWRRS